MIVFQMFLALLVPVVMWYLGGKFRNGAVPYRKEKGIRFRSKRALKSGEAWHYANHLFFHLLRVCGINLGLISCVLFIPVYLKAPRQMWTLCISLFVLQTVAGFLLPWLFTEWMLRRTFDENGVLYGSEEEEQ